jgi:hypothetical protein
MLAVKAISDSFGMRNVPAIIARVATDVAWEHHWGGEILE